MPKIGLRNVKTAIAVLLTMLINVLLHLINPSFAITWYSPFFAGIAAIYSMQSNQSSSFKQARIRSVGSIIGGIFGMSLILFYEHFMLNSMTLLYGEIFSLTVLYLLVGIMIIPLIYAMVLFKQNDFIFVATLTYLSVTISLRNNLPVIPFAINRISSTIIGVMITLLVNQVHIQFYNNKSILFVLGLDGALLPPNKQLTSYTKYQLNHLISHGANITLSTTRTPASLTKILNGIHFKLPLMIMNGSVIFDTITEEYSEIKVIEKKAQKTLDCLFKEENKNVFTYTITDGILSIYYTAFQNSAEKKFFDDRKNDYFRNHVKGKLSVDEDVVYYILLDELEKIKSIQQKIESEPYANELILNRYPYDLIPGFFFLKINSINASKEIALRDFTLEHKNAFIVSVGSKSFDIPMMKASNYSIALESASEDVKEIAHVVLPGNNPDFIMKEVHKIYHQKNLQAYLKRKINEFH
ncbi:MAG: HAD hydrolase family protein [Firmicutes bacterium]|nr:HAD hydrolase family protein [Bacillota bacterium]